MSVDANPPEAAMPYQSSARLNEAQLQAVEHGNAPLLILAGAGTGKTTAITHRITRRVELGLVRPDQVLAVTFTNKAARELRERAAKLLQCLPSMLSMGTFHGICGRILRQFANEVGLTRDFVIYDQDDALAMVKRVMATLNIDPQAFAPRRIRHHIEQWKNRGEAPTEATTSGLDPSQKRALSVYHVYQERLREANAVDFGDMLMLTVHLIRSHPLVKQRLQERWLDIYVDEYQDTNPVQYQLLRELVGGRQSLTVVGDDDQSIYRWRGADLRNILDFERDFAGASLIRLEQNYRSSQNILAVANHVISHNRLRKGKTLFTESEAGEPISLRVFASERAEGDAIAETVVTALEEGTPAGEIAILYRTNAQSRAIEEGLRRRRIDYAVYGGLRFFDRKEIKDALAYLRVLLNPQSEIDFLRVVNTPARGIGKTSLDRLAEYGSQHGRTLFESAKEVGGAQGLAIKGKAKKGLSTFVSLIEEYQTRSGDEDVGQLLHDLLEDSDYLGSLRREGTEEALDRVENLQELVAAVDEYVSLSDQPSLAGFLEEVALATDLDNLDEEGEQVAMMTMHGAKGLEFDVVLMPGLEEGLFPHSRSSDDPESLEEERRLCYVGMTRARRRLWLSAARSRMVYGRGQFSQLSRFLAEIPREYLTLGESALESRSEVPNMGMGLERDEPVHEELQNPFAVGRTVFHRTFGEGTITASRGSGRDQKLTINFAGVGEKTVIARFVEAR